MLVHIYNCRCMLLAHASPHIELCYNREDICLQSFLLLFKCADHRKKRPFVSTANEALVGTVMTIGDVNDIFAIRKVSACI